jgi:hypothetical protein
MLHGQIWALLKAAKVSHQIASFVDYLENYQFLRKCVKPVVRKLRVCVCVCVCVSYHGSEEFRVQTLCHLRKISFFCLRTLNFLYLVSANLLVFALAFDRRINKIPLLSSDVSENPKQKRIQSQQSKDQRQQPSLSFSNRTGNVRIT